LAPERNGRPDLHSHTNLMMLLLFFASFLFFYVYALATERYRRITGALDEFGQFDADYKTKWADHLKAEDPQR